MHGAILKNWRRLEKNIKEEALTQPENTLHKEQFDLGEDYRPDPLRAKLLIQTQVGFGTNAEAHSITIYFLSWLTWVYPTTNGPWCKSSLMSSSSVQKPSFRLAIFALTSLVTWASYWWASVIYLHIKISYLEACLSFFFKIITSLIMALAHLFACWMPIMPPAPVL